METTTPPPAQAAPPVSTPEDKTVAVLSYITLIGFIIAIILHQNKKTKLGAFHLRQVLGYIIAGFVGGICVVILCLVLGLVLALLSKALAAALVGLVYLAFLISMLVLWLIGLIAAIKGEMKPMPVIGAQIQKWFGNMFE